MAGMVKEVAEVPALFDCPWYRTGIWDIHMGHVGRRSSHLDKHLLRR